MSEKRLSKAEIARLGDAIAETAATIDAATHRFLHQLCEFDRAEGWRPTGALSCAHWLSWRVGMDLGTAREKVRVARRLAELPLIDSALKRGEISYSKVRAMTRVATSTDESGLLMLARNNSGAQLDKICRLRHGTQVLDGADPREYEGCRRYVMQRKTADGMVSLQLRLLPEEAAHLIKAFELLGGCNLADGAVALADLALSGASAGEASAKRRVRPPVEVVVHVSADTLKGETELGDGIPAEVSRRLLCDCGVVPMLENEHGKTIDVGRRKRTIPSALRRALQARDSGCRFPGCNRRRFTDAHHVEHWIDGGETNLENTLLLCRRHHRYLHEYGFSVEKGEHELVFRNSAGEIIPPQGERPPVKVELKSLVRNWLTHPITSETNAPRRDGERIDYGVCLAGLA